MLTLEDIGVVITRYNETLFEVQSAIKSVLQNDIGAQHICVVNDKPTEPLNRSSLRYDVQIINNAKNLGVSLSRNVGIDFFVDKKVICFLDADDAWTSGKIEEQLHHLATNPTLKIVSGQMREMSPGYNWLRKPDIRELALNGNPVYLSSIMWRKDANRFTQCKVEDREFVQNYTAADIAILPACLMIKYNFPNRRGTVNVSSTVSKSSGLANRLKLILLKLKSYRNVKLTPLRFLSYTVSQWLAITPQKRAFVAVNPRASEFKNLKRFATRHNGGVHALKFGLRKNNERNPYVLRAQSLKDLIASAFALSLSKTKIVYVGLPGAQIVHEILQFNAVWKTVHVVHGRTTSDKFRVRTDAALTQYDPSGLDAAHIFTQETVPDFILDEKGPVLLIHGYKKGKKYGFKNLFKDISVIRQHSIQIVKVHPTAQLLQIYCKLARIPTLTPGEKVRQVISLSPSYNQMMRRNHIDFTDIRDDD